MGDTSPNLPQPPASGGGGCGGLGQILMVVVAVVVAVYAPQMLANSIPGLFAGAGEVGIGVAGYAAGAAAGSIASQLVGNAIGAVDGFNWQSVALAAISAGATAGLGGGDLLGTTTGTLSNAMVRAAVSNAMSQGIGVVVGLQPSFDWRSVAASASAIGAGVGFGVGSALSGVDMNAYVKAGISSFAAGTAAAVANGGRVSIQQIATNSFNQVLADALAGTVLSAGVQEDRLVQSSQESFRASEINVQNADASGGGQGHAPGYIAGVDGTVGGYSSMGLGQGGSASLPDQYVDTYGGEVTQTGAVRRANGSRLDLTLGGSFKDDPRLLSDQDLLAQMRTKLSDFLHADAMVTNDEYSANEMLRLQGRMQSRAADPFTLESSIVAGQGLKVPSDGFWRGFTGDGRSVLEGPASFGENLGLTVNGLVTGPVRAAYGFASEIGNEYKDAYNLLTRDGASYTPSSALGNSLQRQGVVGTLGDISYALGSGPTKPVFDLLSGDYRAFGEGLPGMAAMGMGAVRGVGSGLRLGSATGLSPTGKSLLPTEGNVGTYDDLIFAGSKGDNITPHHIPSALRMEQLGVARGNGISMNMEQPFPGVGGRHRETFTYGTTADLEMTPRDALAAGVWDARRIYSKDGLSQQIRPQLRELIQQNKAIYPDIFGKQPL